MKKGKSPKIDGVSRHIPAGIYKTPDGLTFVIKEDIKIHEDIPEDADPQGFTKVDIILPKGSVRLG
jgi:hypothetical protein